MMRANFACSARRDVTAQTFVVIARASQDRMEVSMTTRRKGDYYKPLKHER
jgi:hypothetical protein